MPTRSKNASRRREVLVALGVIRERLDWLRREWNVATTVYVEPADRKPGENLYLRDRAQAEYPENQPDAWKALYEQADSAIRELTALRELAKTRYHETTSHTEGS